MVNKNKIILSTNKTPFKMKKIPINKRITSFMHMSAGHYIFMTYFLDGTAKSLRLENEELNKISLEATGEDWETLINTSPKGISTFDALRITIYHEQQAENKKEDQKPKSIDTSNLDPLIAKAINPFLN